MHVHAGWDVVILHPEVMHMSAANVSGSIRLSCDTRWQPQVMPGTRASSFGTQQKVTQRRRM